MKIKKESIQENTFEYLMASNERALKLTWIYSERSWEIFKFYITLTTGAGGLFVALFSAGFSIENVMAIFPVSAAVLFFIGITIYIQLINIDIDHARSIRHHWLLKKCISERTDLEDYFAKQEKLFQINTENSYTYKSKYSLINMIKRALSASGVKTQLVIINSAIGALGLAIEVLNIYAISNILVAIIGISAFLFFVLVHGIYGNFRGRALKNFDDSQ